jgi:hypothetical protein
MMSEEKTLSPRMAVVVSQVQYKTYQGFGPDVYCLDYSISPSEEDAAYARATPSASISL